MILGFAHLFLELLVVDQTGLRVDAVRQGLKEDGRGGDLFLGGVETVGEVASGGKVQSHDSLVGVQYGSVHSEVGRGAGVRLDIDTPLAVVDTVSLEGTRNAQVLDLVDELVTTVIALAGQTLGVLVGQAAAKAFHDGSGGEVLRNKCISKLGHAGMRSSIEKKN